MKPKELVAFLREYIGGKPTELPPVFVWGPPAVGKSAIIKQVALEAGAKVANIDLDKYKGDTTEIVYRFLEDVRLLLIDAVDMKGLPRTQEVNGKIKTVWAQPDFLPDDNTEILILFLDELNAAPRLVQAAAYQLLLDRRVGRYKLPDHIWIMAAGNREEDMAVVERMPTPLKTRLQHIDFETDLDSWKDWAYENNIDQTIISFLNFRPGLLYSFDYKQRTGATPRTWHFLSNIIKHMGNVGLEVASGCVGEGAATEYIAFRDIYKDLPSDPEEIINKGLTFKEPSQVYAVCGMITNLYKNKPTLIDGIIGYSYKLGEEFTVMLVRDCVRMNKKGILRSSKFQSWTEKFGSVIIAE